VDVYKERWIGLDVGLFLGFDFAFMRYPHLKLHVLCLLYDMDLEVLSVGLEIVCLARD
jgi:hypothetical protein